MNLNNRCVVTVLVTAVLAGCAGSAEERRQPKQDFNYLETEPLKEWNQPEGTRKEQYPQYVIPAGDFRGGIGRDVDIRPPQQILQLIPGARAETHEGDVTLWLAREEDLDRVWQTILTMVETSNVPIRTQTDDRIDTDWFTWVSADEEKILRSRSSIVKVNQSSRHGFSVSQIDWEEDGKNVAPSDANKERYNTLMVNLITSSYDQELREEARVRAEELVKKIPISMGQDRSGLPIIIARAPYSVVWQRLPELLPILGLTLEERNRSQGTMKVKYKAPDDEFWESIGTKPISFERSSYNLQLGDLGNRTSINITDGTGKPVNEAVLESIVPVLAAVIERANNASSATE
jgi:outer membrane protein assembly factor BamC